MKTPIWLFLSIAVCQAEPSIKNMQWPERLHEFPAGDDFTFVSGDYDVSHSIPEDTKIQAAGGSGGPIVKITIKDRTGLWQASLTTQSVGERLLAPYLGRPQIEVWGRGGGGSWTRVLYRYVNGEYRSVRIDQFEQHPQHENQKASTAILPDGFHGKAPPEGNPTLYFVETRIPSE